MIVRGIGDSELPITIRRLRDDLSYGMVVENIRRDDLADPAVQSKLRDIWIKDGLVLFEGLEGEDAQLELSKIFGRCIMHPVKEANYDMKLETASTPGITKIEYEPDSGVLFQIDHESRGGALPWHKDLIYLDKINHGGVLRPVVLPSRWGETFFLDGIAAYEWLPEPLKKAVSGLHVTYGYDVNPENQRFGKQHQVKQLRLPPVWQSIADRSADFPLVCHPIVYHQKETGRPVLNISPWFAMGITEMPNAEGEALLDEVVGYAIDERLTYRHEWKIGQMVLWDNWRMLHKTPGGPADELRLLTRTMIEGDYGLGRVLNGERLDSTNYISV